MRRLLYKPGDAASQVAAMVGVKKPRKKGVNVEKVRAELEMLLSAKDFTDMKPVHLVALWARCHESVYGVFPVELAGDAWLAASSSAGKLVRDEFAGDMRKAAEFLRWTWNREKFREERSRRNAEERVSRIGWRLMFAQRYLLTDYRIDVARKAAP